MPNIEAAVRTHIGTIRANNEDNFYLNGVTMRIDQLNAGGLFQANSADKLQLYAVCDGMGGLGCGEQASTLAAKNLDAVKPIGMRKFPKRLVQYIAETGREICALQEGGKLAGTTLAMTYFSKNKVRVANIGDSRVYFKRLSNQLTLVTKDHTQAQWFVEQGMITSEQAETHSSRNALRRFIGTPESMEIDNSPYVLDAMRIKVGDMFLICSDGLSEAIGIDEMDNTLSYERSCSDISKTLVTLAIKNKAKDNVTAMVLKVLQ